MAETEVKAAETEAKPAETTSSKMDMGLDDIIKATRKPRRGGGRGGRGAGRGGRGAGRNTRGGRGGGGRSFGGQGAHPGLKTSGPPKLTITNLHHGVSDSDIGELFSEFGTMKSATIHYNRNGKSLGTAQVTFAKRQDAMKAMMQYNGVHLDGRPMKVSMEGGVGVTAVGPVKRLGQGGRGRGRGGRGRGGRGRGGRGGGRGGKSDSKPKTAEELDAEMDAYLKTKKQTADDLDAEMDAYINKKGEKAEES